MIAGLLLLSQQGAHSSYFPGLFFAFVLLGAGAGSSFMPLLTIAMSEVPTRDAGLASGIVNVSMQIGAAIGLAALATLATDRTRTLTAAGHSTTSALIGGYHLAFVVGAACIAVGAVLAPFVLRPRVGLVDLDTGPAADADVDADARGAPVEAESQAA